MSWRKATRFSYPATCHPALLTRRQLLAGGAAVVAAGALGARIARAGADGTAIIRQWTTRPEDPAEPGAGRPRYW